MEEEDVTGKERYREMHYVAGFEVEGDHKLRNVGGLYMVEGFKEIDSLWRTSRK